MPARPENAGGISSNMRALQQAYLTRLAGHVQDFLGLEKRLSSAMLPQEELQGLYRLSHNFAGSGTTFGFPRLSETANALYNALGALIGTKDTPPPTRAELLVRLNGFIKACEDATTRIDPVAQEAKPQPAPATQTAIQEALVVGIWRNAESLLPDLAEKLMRFGYRIVESSASGHSPAAASVNVWLVCSDMNANDKQAIDALAAGASARPIIILSPRVDFDTRLAAVRCGAQGYFAQSEDVLKIIERIERVAGRQAEAQSYRVLIVDDDKLLAEHYIHTLAQAGMEAVHVENPQEALQALSAQVIDLVLLDYTMPECSGAELASVIRQHAEYMSLPIVFLSAKGDVESQLIDSGLGIDDFLIKPVAAEQLVSVVRSRATRSSELRGLMVRDSFTGLLGHAYFLEKLEAELMRVQRSGGETIYAMLDLDHFKRINDTYGHAAGDQVIKSMSRMLQQRLRRSDIIGRCGGEEFGILMPGCPKGNAIEILESLREAFRQTAFAFGTDNVHVTLSGGLTRIDAQMNVNQLTATADSALYRAKKEGRNRIIAA